MRIASVRPLLIDRYLYVEIVTDSGLSGIGESGAWGFQEAAAEAVKTFARYLVGEDPLRIEHHFQYMYRWAHFRGSVVMGALSAIDVALWDIAGKHYGAPIHALIGGKVRDKARAYAHVYGRTKDELFAGVASAKAAGFTAVGHLTPFLDSPRDEPYHEAHARKIGDAVETVARYRELAGPDVDLCIELHRRLSPAEAVQFGRAVEKYLPLFIEDPVTPDNFDEMAAIAAKVATPIATGERLTSLWEFQMLLARGGAQYFRPSIGLVGGISGMRKIAALAEGSHIGIVPHNPLSEIALAACLQIAATTPAFVIQEYPGPRWTQGTGTAKAPPIDGVTVHDGKGFLPIGDAPGLGVTLHADAESRFPYRPRVVETRLHLDGSVVDQ